MDERDNKAMNGELSFEKATARLIKASNSMSKAETNKLSAEAYLNQSLIDPDENWTHLSKEFTIEIMKSFASIRVEQAKKEWAIEKLEMESKIHHLTQVINYQG